MHVYTRRYRNTDSLMRLFCWSFQVWSMGLMALHANWKVYLKGQVQSKFLPELEKGYNFLKRFCQVPLVRVILPNP